MAIKAWIECPHCGGAFLIVRDAAHLPKNDGEINPADFIRPDGGWYLQGEGVEPCITCGEAASVDIFAERRVRTGDQYPDVTRERFATRPLPGEDA